MANTLITVDQLSRDASLLMSDRMNIAKVCSRTTEQKFANREGDNVKVQVPAIFAANTFTSTTTAQNITQTYENVTIEKHFEVTVNLTSAERTLKLDDFNKNITIPAVNALQDEVEEYLALKMHGYALNSGTGGTNPSTVAHIVAGRKVLQDAKLKGDYVGIISTTTEAALLQLAQFQSRDYAGDVATVSGEIGRRFGIDWLVSRNASGFTNGDVAGTVLTNGTQAAGTRTLVTNDYTNATGTIYEGTRFTITGHSTVYVVTADATKASNAATLSIYPALQVEVANDIGLTFKTAATDDILMVKGSMACAIIPPAPLAIGSATANISGVGIRVTSGTSTSTLSDTIVFDVLCGARVIHRYAGLTWQA